MLKKRGQLTVFMILGIVLVAVFVFLILITNTLQTTQLENEREQVVSQLLSSEGLRLFVEDCLEDEIQVGVSQLAQQNGLWGDFGRDFATVDGVDLGENLQIAYAFVEHETSPENKYPCLTGETETFCNFTFPETKGQTLERGVFPDILARDLNGYLQATTSECVQGKIKQNISQSISFDDVASEFSTEFTTSGFRVVVHFPVSFTLGQRQEYFQLSEFDFFYPTKLLSVLEVVTFPFTWESSYFDFNYSAYPKLVEEGTFTYRCSTGDCVQTVPRQRYLGVGITDVKNQLNVDAQGTDLFRYTYEDIDGEREVILARENRPPALDAIMQCPAEGYEYLVVPGAQGNLGVVNITAHAHDPDEEEVTYEFSADGTVLSTSQQLTLVDSSSIPNQIRVSAIDAYGKYDWQIVRIKKEEQIIPTITLRNLVTNEENVISAEDPFCVEITVPSTTSSATPGTYQFQLLEGQATIPFAEAESAIPIGTCDLNEFSDYEATIAELREYIGEGRAGTFYLPITGEVSYPGGESCTYTAQSTVEVTVQSCTPPQTNPEYPYPYLENVAVNELYQYDRDGVKKETRSPFVATNYCCREAGTIVQDTTTPVFNTEGCFTNEYYLDSVVGICDGIKGNAVGNVAVTPIAEEGIQLCGNPEKVQCSQGINPACAEKKPFSLIESVGWCGGNENPLGCGEGDLCSEEVVSKNAVVVGTPRQNPEQFSCGCTAEAAEQRLACDTDFDGEFEGVCAMQGILFENGLFQVRPTCQAE